MIKNTICGLQASYQLEKGKRKMGTKMLIKLDGQEKKIVLFEKGDYLQSIEGAQDIEKHFKYLKFISKNGKTYEFGKLGKHDIKQSLGNYDHERPCCMSLGLHQLKSKRRIVDCRIGTIDFQCLKVLKNKEYETMSPLISQKMVKQIQQDVDLTLTMKKNITERLNEGDNKPFVDETKDIEPIKVDNIDDDD